MSLGIRSWIDVSSQLPPSLLLSLPPSFSISHHSPLSSSLLSSHSLLSLFLFRSNHLTASESIDSPIPGQYREMLADIFAAAKDVECIAIHAMLHQATMKDRFLAKWTHVCDTPNTTTVRRLLRDRYTSLPRKSSIHLQLLHASTCDKDGGQKRREIATSVNNQKKRDFFPLSPSSGIR